MVNFPRNDSNGSHQSQLTSHRQKLGDLIDRIPALSSEVQTVRLTDKLMDVIQLLAQREVGAVPVLDDKGALVTTFSASDLRHVPSRKTGVSDESVGQWLKRHRAGHLRKPATVSLDHTLEEAIHRLLLARVHRLWVVEKPGHKVQGLLSVTHILRLLHAHFNPKAQKA